MVGSNGTFGAADAPHVGSGGGVRYHCRLLAPLRLAACIKVLLVPPARLPSSPARTSATAVLWPLAPRSAELTRPMQVPTHGQ